MTENELKLDLLDIYNFFYKDIFTIITNRSKNKWTNDIRNRISILILTIERYYNTSRIDLSETLFNNFVTEDFKKYDCTKSNLKTFLLKYIEWKLRRFIRGRNKYKYNKETGRMEKKNYLDGDIMDIGNRVYDYDIDNVVYNDININIEIEDIYLLAEKNIPNEINRQVVLGELSINEGFNKQNKIKSYSTYERCINKLNEVFKNVLIKEGYNV